MFHRVRLLKDLTGFHEAVDPCAAYGFIILQTIQEFLI